MEEKIRILGIAPYEGMQWQLKKAAQEYPQIQLDILVGDLEEGVEAAQSNFHANYDILISRGGTAQLLRERVSLPVVDIPITELDILRALRLADTVPSRPAIIGFPTVTRSAQVLNSVLQYPLQIVTVHNRDEISSVLKQLTEEGCHTILCDMVTNTIARQLGLSSILITSGKESIQEAFEKALLLFRSMKQLQTENHFLRQVIYGQSTEIVVFDKKKELFFSTTEPQNRPAILAMLKAEIEGLAENEPNRIIKSLKGILYTIKGLRLQLDGQPYTIFYFTRSKAPLASNKYGIRYYNRREALDHFFNGFYSTTGAIGNLEDTIAKLNQSDLPIIVAGEEGTGKEPVATIIYTRSALRHHPMISIDCSLLNDKTWDFLQSSHNSPLTQAGTTLLISGISALSDDRRAQLVAALVEMDVCSRNRVIFSCVLSPGTSVYEKAGDLVDRFSCLTLSLPPLRQQIGELPRLISLYLSQLNVTLAKEILGIEPEALQKMQEFTWPYNYSQLERVLKELVTMADGDTITTAEVEKVLSLENHSPIVPNHVSLPERFDLNRSLEEMNQEWVRLVVKENGGNQSAAAKQLGISRTTVWRYCKI